VQIVVLGSGDAVYQQGLKTLMARHPGQLAVVLGFDEALAHLIEGGADIFLMPSRYEPAGLNQLYSLKYGTLPVVRDTGGLSNTVAGGVTGFSFKEFQPAAFLAAVRRALRCYRETPAQWHAMQLAAMTQDWSWTQRVPEYEALYRRVRRARV
jgi:starch synthase